MADKNKNADVDPFANAEESAGGSLIKWDEVGKTVTGVVIGKREVKMSSGMVQVYDLLTKDGEVAVPCPMILKDKLKRVPTDGSKVVKITFTETKKGNQPQPAKLFSVKVVEKTDAVLAALGIVVFDETVGEDGEEIPM